MIVATILCLILASASALPHHEPIPRPSKCSSLCKMFYSFLDQDGDGYASIDELVNYFDALDSRYEMGFLGILRFN